MTFAPSRFARSEENFSRQMRRNDGAYWVRSPAPLEPLWKSWAAGICLCGFLYGLMMLIGMFGG